LMSKVNRAIRIRITIRLNRGFSTLNNPAA
jgi:hypothetical protein